MAGPHSRADEMQCVKCGSEAVTERPERTAQGYRRFRCRRCGKQFNERTGGLLNRTQYPSDVIALVVLWRLRYKLSLRDLPEMFLVRGLVFSHEAVREWEAKLTRALAEDLRRRRRGKAGRSWYVDETSIKVRARWCYLYRAIDRYGKLVDVPFSDTRDMEAAQRSFAPPRTVAGVTPDQVTTDGHDAYPRAIRTRLGRGRAPPDQPLQEQSDRAGPPQHRAESTIAGFRGAPNRPPGSAGLTTSSATSRPLPPQPARPRRPPSTASCSAGPRPCWPSSKRPDRPSSQVRRQAPYSLARGLTEPVMSSSSWPRWRCRERCSLRS